MGGGLGGGMGGGGFGGSSTCSGFGGSSMGSGGGGGGGGSYDLQASTVAGLTGMSGLPQRGYTGKIGGIPSATNTTPTPNDLSALVGPLYPKP
jgi:hypothetical protein